MSVAAAITVPLALPTAASGATNGAPVVDRKLIEFGWDVPAVRWLKAHLSERQDLPFDGMAFSPKYTRLKLFEPGAWTAQDLRLRAMGNISWGRYTDNFLLVWAAGETEMDWTDEVRWRDVLQHAMMLSRAMVASGAKGIFFDPEFYFSGVSGPWRYDPHRYDGMTFEEAESLVRTRGASFIDALTTYRDDVDLVSLFAISYAASVARYDRTQLVDQEFALLPAFLEGVLIAAGPEVRLIDGDEIAYFVDETTKWGQRHHLIDDRTAPFVHPSAAAAYGTQVSVAEPVFMDLTYGAGRWDRGYSREYGLAWLEHNVYHAMVTADEYAWFYSEQAHWWQDWLPEGVQDAVASAREKVRAGLPLGFNMVKSQADYDRNVEAAIVDEPAVQLQVSGSRTARAWSPASVSVDVADASTVELYVDGHLWATGTGSPFTFDLSGLTSGEHLVIATAYTDTGHSTSNPVMVTMP